MSDMINPIIIVEDKNICPFCRGEIVLVQHESTVISLDKDGVPYDAGCLKFESIGICKDCHKEIRCKHSYLH